MRIATLLKHLLCIGVAISGLCSTMAAADFPMKYQLKEHLIEKRGDYRYVYRVFFKLYDAAFFTTKEAQPKDVVNATVPFHLEFHYLRTIEKSIILKSADKMLERNLSSDERQQIDERVAQINAAYKTVNKGDRSSLTFIPGHGTELRINGKLITTIEGNDFAQLYFRIWIGEQPISESMKIELLGLAK